MQSTDSGLESNSTGIDQATLLQSFVEQSPAAIAMFDREMHYVLASRRWLEDYGLVDRDPIGQSHYDLFPALPPHWRAVHQRCLAGAIERSEEEAVTHPDSSIEWLKWEVRPWRDHTGAIGGIMIFAELITEQKQQALALQQVNAELEASISARNAELEQTVKQLQQEVRERHAALRDREQAERELRESKQLLQLVFDLLPQRVFWKDRNFRYLGCNRLFAQDAQLESPEQMIGKNDFEMVWREEAHLYRADDTAVMQNNLSRINYEESQTRADGVVNWVRTSKTPLRDETGAIVGVFGTYEDITDYKQAQLDLAESEGKFRRLVEDASDYIFAISAEGTFTYISPQFTQFFGYDPAEFIGRPFTPLVHPDDLALCEAAYERLITTGNNEAGLEFRHHCKDGGWCWVSSNLSPIKNGAGEMSGYQGVMRDISDRKEAEAALQKEQVFLKTVLDHLADGIVACDETGRLTLFNRATREFHGLPEAGLPAEQWAPYFSLYHADGKTLMRTQDIPLMQAFEGKIIHNVEMVIAPLHGQARAFLASGQAFFDQNGNKLGAVVALHDVTAERDRKQAEAQLQEQEQFLRSIYDGVSCSIFVIDVLENGGFHYASHNHTSERLTGYQSADVAGKAATELFGATEGAAIDQFLSRCVAARTTLTETEHLTFDGKPTWVLTTFNPLINAEGNVHRIVGTSFNITDLKQAEAKLKQQAVDLEHALQELQRTQTQMVQSEKMSSLGQLVAGVAHEINNPVNFIYGNLLHANEYTQDLLHLLALYQQHYPIPDVTIRDEIEAIDLDFLMTDLPKLLASMKVGADRIQRIVASLRSFSRLDEAEVKDVDIHEGIDSTLMILHNRLKSKSEYPAIQIVKDYGDLPRIECYAGQLNQVFMNILSNAIDALDEQNQQRSPAEVAEHPSVVTIKTRTIGTDYVTVQITDNGPGIPEAVQKRLFDPFFTTKAVGKGTGMGMSISHQVITERHQGRLRCVSSPGQGATFVIEIPTRQTHSAL